MNDYEKDDYLSDRKDAMILVMQEPPEESLMRAYDEGFKKGVIKACSLMLCYEDNVREVIDVVKDIKKWEGTLFSFLHLGESHVSKDK